MENVISSAESRLKPDHKIQPSHAAGVVQPARFTQRRAECEELIARAIHRGSRRAGQAFIAVNCGSIPSSLIASELFGHEKGAFTGPLQQRQGRFELAHQPQATLGSRKDDHHHRDPRRCEVLTPRALTSSLQNAAA
jgi:hypothetical protein